MSNDAAAVRLRALTMLLVANLFWGLSFPLIKAITLLHAKLLPEAGTWFSAIYTVAPRFLLGTAIWWRCGRATRGGPTRRSGNRA